MRLIDADELLKAVDTWDKFGCDADTKLVPIKDCYVPYIHYDDVVKAIKGMPTVCDIDAIRAEIKELSYPYNLEAMRTKSDVLQIIDKYTKGEQG